MAEEKRGRGYCPTYGEGNDSRQLDVAITMVNIETPENKVGNFLYLYWIHFVYNVTFITY